MDEGKILVVNLSKGLIGEDNAGILGAFLVTKIQLAAMSRSDIPDVEKRRPFYLYVDEFQNFATDSFAVILSEARKYGLNLTVANQYTAQMTDAVRDAVFGNVGTTISFRVSADDAPILSKQFEPTFEAQDLLQMNNRNFVISMIINGEKVPAFSATTLNIPKTPQDNFEAIVRSSREKYSRNRAEIEAEIRETIEQSEKYKKELSDSGRINPAEEQGTNWGSNYGVERTHVSGPKPTFITNSGKEVTVSSPADVKKSKLSPNAASGKQSAGLKDLKKILDEQKAEKAEKKREEQAQKKVLNPKDMPGVDSLPEAPKAQLEKTELVRAVDKKELSHIKEKAAAAEAPKSHEKILGNETEKNPFRNNERNSRRRKNRNKRKKNAPKTLQERLDAPQIDRAVNFASDLHDGRPGVATSQNVNPGAHQDTFRQNLRGNDDENNSGYLSILH